jgi:PAS domain S-box-containing protein
LEELMHKRTEDLRHTQFAIDTASEAVLWVSENGRVSYANNAACSLFEYGREDFLGMSMFDLFDTYTPPKWNQYWSMIKEQGTITYVYPYTTKSGKKKFLELHCNYFEFHEAGEICTFIRDITDKILAQKAVKQSNKFLENIFSTIADGFLVSYAGVIVRSNSAAERLLGYDAGELIGMYTADLIPGGPAYAELRATIIKSHASGEMLRQMEAAFLKKNGALVPVEFSLNHLKDDSGNVTGAVISMRDITERKQSQTVLLERECELQQSQTRLRQLSAQVLQAQEEERRRLARELHDDLGQALALLKIRICSLGKKISDHESALQCDCRETERYLEQIIDSIRRISRDLSPAVLEDLGLTEALRILCAEFARHHNLELTCSLAAIDGLLAPEAQINLYRFCQEALTNIQKHSRADRFSVVVECQNNYITLRIQDNGMGFNTGRTVPPQQSPRGMGLTTLEERAGMLHGSFTIRSDPGAGTSVALQFPVVTAS